MRWMLPMGNRMSIPVGYLPTGCGAYHVEMANDLRKIRQERLNELLRTQYKATDLARLVGVVDNYISRAKTGKKGIGEESAREWERKLGLPAYWFDQPSQGDLGISPQIGQKSNYPIAAKNDAVVQSVDGMPTEPAEIGNRRVPLISYVQAGSWTTAEDPYVAGDASDWLFTDLILSDAAFALTIKGDSMAPDFLDGDRIIVDPGVTPVPGDLVVAKNGHEEATFKKYRPRGIDANGKEVFELVPLNPDYPTIYSDRQPVRIIGVMMEHRRRRRR